MPAVTERIISCLRNRGSDTVFFAVATVTGLIAGAGAWLLKFLIADVSEMLTSHFVNGDIHCALLALPMVGIVLASAYQRFIIHRDISHGVERIQRYLNERQYRISSEMLFSPIASSVLTLGFGGSAGSEGPIATTGAAIGSNLSRRMGLPESSVGLMVAIGAGACIAGIFKAPVGGILFSLEVLGMAMNTTAVLALTCSCLAASLTANILSGFKVAVAFSGTTPSGAGEAAAAIVLGLFCGFYSIIYAGAMRSTRRRLESISKRWLRNIIAGTVLAVAVFIFPSLFGEGYGVIGKVINGDTSAMAAASPLTELRLDSGWLVLAVTAGVALVKGIAMSATTSGGGVAGDFAPTLFAGCAAGLIFAMVANMMPGVHLPPGNFALYGMAATMAGALKAPLMAIFLVTEMTASFAYILPVAIGAGMAYGIVRIADAFIRPNK